MKKVAKVLYVILGILIVGAGISCMLSPIYTTSALGYIVGLSMILDAVGIFINWIVEKKDGNSDGWLLAGSILSAVFGFFILNSTALQLTIDVFIVYYSAAWLLILGITVIVRSLRLRRIHKNWNTKVIGIHWCLSLCTGILLGVFGILCMFKPLIMASVIGVFIGIGIISAGANMITFATTPEEK